MADLIRPTFVGLDGNMTEDGRRLIEWMESQFVESDKDSSRIAEINALSGDVKHYYVNVYKMHKQNPHGGGISAEKWLNDYRNSIALNAYRNMRFIEEQAEVKAEAISTSERTKTLEENMQKLSETLTAKIEELSAANVKLQEELDAIKAKRTSKKAKTDEEIEGEE